MFLFPISKLTESMKLISGVPCQASLEIIVEFWNVCYILK